MKDTIKKDLRDIGKLLITAGLVGFILENKHKGKSGIIALFGIALVGIGNYG